MKPPIGFVLTTHGNAEQLLFLCERLSAMFDDAPIAIHHDFSQTKIDPFLFPKNVTFVRNWLRTSWCSFSVTEGQHRALELLYGQSDPDWFVLLSAADYPIQTADFILNDLYSHDFDVYLDHREIRRCTLPAPADRGDFPFTQPFWERVAFERYVAMEFRFRLAYKLKLKRKALYLRSPAITERFTPFNDGMKCFAGDHWLTGNRKTANTLLDRNATYSDLFRHFQSKRCAEEGFNHTILGNTAGLNICPDNKRYTDWTGCVDHPRTLTGADHAELLASADHFARKFAFVPESLRELDRLVAGKGSGSVGSVGMEAGDERSDAAVEATRALG